MEKRIIITGQMGHEIMACQWAKALGTHVVVSSKKTSQDAYEEEVNKIAANMRYFAEVEILPWAKREQASQFRDIIAELKTGSLDFEWGKFMETNLEVSPHFDEPEFPLLAWKTDKVMCVPGKSISDCHFGITATAQSVSPEVFDFLTTVKNVVLGQHFDKDKDLDNIKSLYSKWYIPGLEENSQLLGLRGVEHRMLHNLFFEISACVGVAGTYTWTLLTCWPQTPQVILYHKGLENWEAISRAARSAGRRIAAVPFDETMGTKEIKDRIRKACYSVSIHI